MDFDVECTWFFYTISEYCTWAWIVVTTSQFSMSCISCALFTPIHRGWIGTRPCPVFRLCSVTTWDTTIRPKAPRFIHSPSSVHYKTTGKHRLNGYILKKKYNYCILIWFQVPTKVEKMKPPELYGNKKTPFFFIQTKAHILNINFQLLGTG